MKLVLSVLLIMLLALVMYGKNKAYKKKVKADDSSLIIPSNGESGRINIKKMVAAQIEQAHKKMIAEQSKSKTAETKNVKIKKAAAISHSLITLPDFFNSLFTTWMKIKILVFASIIAAFVIVIRRKKSSKLFRTKQALKNNIKLLREEKIFVKHNNKLSGVRSRLKNSPSLYNQSKEGLLKAAKELNISQSEILLAAKIKSNELNKTWFTK